MSPDPSKMATSWSLLTHSLGPRTSPRARVHKQRRLYHRSETASAAPQPSSWMPTRAKLIKCSDEYFFRFEQRQKNARTSVHFLHLKGYGNITRYAQRRSRCIAELRDESRALIRDRFYLDFPRRDCKGRVIALTASGEHVADS